MINKPSSLNLLRWFDPRNREIGTWGFILNRITALGLSLYLFLHLFMLSKLALGPQAYDSFITLAKSPVIKIGELFVIAAGVIHGLNGIRIGLNSFGIAVRYQKELFIGLMALALLAIAIFTYFMFFAA